MSQVDRGPRTPLTEKIVSQELTNDRRKMIARAEALAEPKSEKRIDYRYTNDGKILHEKVYNGVRLVEETSNTYDQDGKKTKSERVVYDYTHMLSSDKEQRPTQNRYTRDYHYRDDGKQFMEIQTVKHMNYQREMIDAPNLTHTAVHVHPGEKYENEITDNMVILTHNADGSVNNEHRYLLKSEFITDYDEHGRRLKSVHIGENGRPFSVTEYGYADNDDGSYVCTETYSQYDDAGMVKSVKEVKSTYELDSKGKALEVSRVNNGQNIYQFNVYDKTGNRLQSVERRTERDTLTVKPEYAIRAYTYDHFGNVAEETERIWKEPETAKTVTP